MALTAKQEQFVRHFLVHNNGTQAAISAGYSEKTARSIASENLKKPEVAAAIALGRARSKKRLDAKAQHLESEIALVAFATLGDALIDGGKFKPLNEWPPELLAAVQSVKLTKRVGPDGTRNEVTGVKLQNKTKALGALLKRYGHI